MLWYDNAHSGFQIRLAVENASFMAAGRLNREWQG